MRLTIATSWPYPHLGGISTHIALLKRALEKQRHSVIVASGGARPSGLSGLAGEELHKSRFAAQLLTATADADAILAEDVLAVAAIRESLQWRHTPLVLTVHGYLAGESLGGGVCDEGDAFFEYLLGTERRAYQDADQVVAVADRVAAHIRSLCSRDVHVIENAVETDVLQPPSPAQKAALRGRFGFGDTPVVVFAGRLTRVKGLDVAIKALTLIPERLRPAFVIAGEGDMQEDLKRLAVHFGLTGRVHFLGAVSRETVLDLYRAGDIAILPSVPLAGTEEGNAMAALEALAMGIPLIASRTGGLARIGADGAAVLSPAGDPAALAEAIARLVSDPAERDRQGKRGRQAAEQRYNTGAWVERHLAVIEAAQSAHAQRPKSRGAAPSPTPPMRVAFALTQANNAEAVNLVLDLAESLQALGHQVWVVARDQRPAWRQTDVPWVLAGEEPAPLLQAADVAVATNWLELAAFRGAGVPLLHLELGTAELFNPAPLNAAHRRFMDEAYGAPGVRHVSLSPFSSNVLLKRFGVNAVQIPPGVDPKVFHPAPREAQAEGDLPAVLVVADDTWGFRRFEMALEASQLLRWAGMQHELIQVAMTDQVRYPHPRTRVVNPSPAEFASLCRRARVLVVTSSAEGSPLAPLQAMACGTPVVATDCGGIHSYANTGQNCLIAADTPAAVAQAVASVLRDPALRQRLVAEGLSTAAKYRLDQSAAAMAQQLACARAADRRPAAIAVETAQRFLRSGSPQGVDLGVRLALNRDAQPLTGEDYDEAAAQLWAAGYREDVVAVLERAMEGGGTEDNRVNLGAALLDLGRYHAAESLLLPAARAGNRRAILQLALTYALDGKPGEARRLLEPLRVGGQEPDEEVEMLWSKVTG